MLKTKRQYRTIPLAFLLVWSLAMMFTHNQIKFVEGSIINFYFNVAVMFEGFIYILAGILLLKTIIEHSTNLKFIYALLPIALLPLIKSYSYGGRITPIVAVGLSAFIYLILKKRYLLSAIIVGAGSIFAVVKWQWIVMKFACRPYVWIELARQMFEHPFVGSGFNHTLNPDNMVWIRKIGAVVYGWIYRHNDFLSIGAYLGVFAFICVLWFVVQSIRRIGISPYLIPFLAIVLTSCGQMTMFEPDKAAICLVIGAISLQETYKRRVT